MVEKSLAGGKHYVVDVGLYLLLEGAVALDRELQIGAVVANHKDLCGRQFVALHLVDPSLDGLFYLG